MSNKENDLIRVQHSVVVQNAADMRALNDLLSTGWRAVQTASMGTGVLIILENIGTEETIKELRDALGYSPLSGDGNV